jgi:hypothetical protein
MWECRPALRRFAPPCGLLGKDRLRELPEQLFCGVAGFDIAATRTSCRLRLPEQNASNGEDIMRALLGAIAIAATIGFAGPCGAATTPTNATGTDVVAALAKGIVVAQRCRCVERRWNGSCKLRVCRDRW